MTNCLGRAAFAALITFGAASAHAQITTVIATPKRNEPSQQQAARREQAAQDSLARVTLTGMTEWVDSAAASLALRPDTTGAARSVDSSTAQQPARPTPTDSSTVKQAAKGEVDLRSGAKAPNTATPIPTLGLIGTVLILLGVGLRRAPRAVESRASR